MPAKSTSATTRAAARTTPVAARRRRRSSGATEPGRATTRKAVTRERPRSAATDAITLLRDDHRRVAAMFAQLGKPKADGTRKEALVAKLCRALTVHAAIEEEIFYPAARTVLDDAAPIDEADVEHAMVKALVAELERAKPGDDHYDATIKVLGEVVQHHVEEEQDRVFPKLRRTQLDMRVLGERLAARRRELAGVLDDPSVADAAMRSLIPMV